ncbi:conserved hypothetical protein [Clostridium botulinum Bf]|nr:conserved hypothetical protein [Clostridium botulinum Bf]
MQFAIDMELEHKRIKRGRHKEDIYNQCVFNFDLFYIFN